MSKPDPMAEDELKQEHEKLLFNFLKDYIDNVDKRFYNVTDNLEVSSSIAWPKFKKLINAYTTNKIIEELERLQKLHTRTYRQTVTDNTGGVYVDDTRSYISKYETQERIAELKEALNHRKEQPNER